MQLTVYRLSDGVITHWLECPEESVAMQIPENQGLGAIEGQFHPSEYRVVNGVVVAHSLCPPVMPWVVNAEASRRIEGPFPIWKQMNILRNGSAKENDEMNRYIDAVRAASNALDPPPNDYADDKYWPSLDETTRTL